MCTSHFSFMQILGIPGAVACGAAISLSHGDGIDDDSNESSDDPSMIKTPASAPTVMGAITTSTPVTAGQRKRSRWIPPKKRMEADDYHGGRRCETDAG